ncbi:uncharacterized protein LOC132612000 [Lycium barbarum]|uniref:uncharacterized protein LOC132612000 n=1 Tax=Lycium barbarum TaxID=112863 RepID=UPI00293E7E07|nr:uncharacterized protein LOC132612000 [Lycium barbarum]
MTDSFYSTKKLMRGLGLPVEKIDCCKNSCMIYWREDSELVNCKFCAHPRFKISKHRRSKQQTNIPYKQMSYFPLTPRLQRLYASNATPKHMRWHSEHERDGVMRHPSDAPAWKHFDQAYPCFASEVRNVRLGLSTDGFQPFGQSGRSYSSWPVIVTPYNFPPWMCMKDDYMFLSVIIPGPKNPKQKVDVFLQPLIHELKELWEEGVQTYDVSSKNNFQMKVALMWTISDFPAYSMLSGWSTARKLACPYCKEDSDDFSLPNDRKVSWFDNHRKFLPSDHPWRRNKKWFKKGQTVHKVVSTEQSGLQILREIEDLGLMKVTELGSDAINTRISKNSGCGWKKRSIFWDLPYWKTNLIRHNLDVMHIEKNVFDNIFNTLMNVKGKTKDNAKSRADLKLLCHRPELHQDESTKKYPKACYMLDDNAKEVLCKWLQELRFPDGYVSNMGRCVDMNKLKLFGMKSHDCHVFMQRLIPIAFRELPPQNVWQPLAELSLFFKDLTSTTITEEQMGQLERNITLILNKLERIFPPIFWDSMEHLPIHLAYEARLAGPVQYRWMYPFERNLRRLKNNVKNKNRVEGSMCNACLVEEASSFCAHYFESHISTRHRKVPRNSDDGGVGEGHPGMLSIFKHASKGFGKKKKRRIYEDNLRHIQPYIQHSEIDTKLETEFASWFERYARDPSSGISNQIMKDLAEGSLHKVQPFNGYVVNGYKFHTEEYGSSRSTMNSGVCIKGSSYSADDMDYYGRLVEILQLEYPALPFKRTVLFKCSWFDPTPKHGTRVYPQYNLVDVNKRRTFNKYEPFIMVVQATQVYLETYPTLKRTGNEWLAVCKIKARLVVDVPNIAEQPHTLSDPAFQEDDSQVHEIDCNANEILQTLNDPNRVLAGSH